MLNYLCVNMVCLYKVFLYTPLTALTTCRYLIFVLMADYKGEGGIFALVSLVLHTKGNQNPYAALDNPELLQKEVPMKEVKTESHDIPPSATPQTDDHSSKTISRRSSMHDDFDHEHSGLVRNRLHISLLFRLTVYRCTLFRSYRNPSFCTTPE